MLLQDDFLMCAPSVRTSAEEQRRLMLAMAKISQASRMSLRIQRVGAGETGGQEAPNTEIQESLDEVEAEDTGDEGQDQAGYENACFRKEPCGGKESGDDSGGEGEESESPARPEKARQPATNNVNPDHIAAIHAKKAIPMPSSPQRGMHRRTSAACSRLEIASRLICERWMPRVSNINLLFGPPVPVEVHVGHHREGGRKDLAARPLRHPLQVSERTRCHVLGLPLVRGRGVAE